MTYVGQRVPSLTNTRLVAGRGRFVDDITLPVNGRLEEMEVIGREIIPEVQAVAA